MTHPVLIYDGECPMCRSARAWLEARVPVGALEYLPCQDERRAEVAPGMAREECLQAMQLVRPDGHRLAGEKALPALLQMTPGWRWLGRLLELPGMGWLTGPVYAVIARNRLSISRVFFAKSGPACDSESGCNLDGKPR